MTRFFLTDSRRNRDFRALAGVQGVLLRLELVESQLQAELQLGSGQIRLDVLAVSNVIA